MINWHDISPDIPTKVYLHTNSLLSKWGFGDGDKLDWLFDVDPSWDRREVLHAVIEQKMLPELLKNHTDVELVFIECCHNSSRLRSIDGIDVSHQWYDGNSRSNDLKPKFIELTGQEIVDIARKLYAK